jgi:hypothetical protein
MMRKIEIKKKSGNFKPDMTAKETHVRGPPKLRIKEDYLLSFLDNIAFLLAKIYGANHCGTNCHHRHLFASCECHQHVMATHPTLNP